MRKGRAFILAALISGVCSGLRADATISVSADKNRIDLNDTVRLSVVVEGSGNVPAPQLPDLSAFNVYSSGRSQNISFVNGRMSSSVSYNYNLMPKGVGKFTIPPFSVTLDGKTVQSEPIEIEVVAAGAPPQAAPKPAGKSGAPIAFVKLLVNRSRVYLNEQVILRFRFYHRVNLLANPEYHPPELTGFVYEDLPPPKNFTESVNGVGYHVTEIKTALFPAKTGKIVILPATLKIAVQDMSQVNPEDFFNSFFGGGAKEYGLKTDPLEMEVLSLPGEGKPQGFTGGVGTFGLSASLDKVKTAVGEPITLSVSITGEGNIKSLGDPIFPEFQGFRKYDTASSLNIDKSHETVQGSKVYKIVLVPQSSGRQVIAPVIFNYFNLAEKKYKSLKTSPISVDIKPGNPNETPKYAASFKTPEIQMMQEEIRFIKLKNPSRKPFRWLHKSKYFTALHLLPLGILAAALLYRLKNIMASLNPEKRRQSNALETALKELKMDRPMEALSKYFSDKMLVPPQGLTQKQAEEFLQKSNLAPEVVGEVKQLWLDLDLLHYAPSHFEKSGHAELIGRTRALLKKMDKVLPMFVLMLFGAAFAFVQETADPFLSGNQFYQEGKYPEASEQYLQALAQNGENSVTEYNLGNACFKMGSSGEAILHWARAYRMGLTDADVRYNLQFATARAGEPFFADAAPLRWTYILLHYFSINAFSAFWILSLWSACLYFSMRLFRNAGLKNILSAAVLVILFVSGSLFAVRLQEEDWNSWAVVTGPKAEVRAGPGTQFSVGFMVPEGRRVRLMEDTLSGDWVQIGVSKEGLKGWVASLSVKKI